MCREDGAGRREMEYPLKYSHSTRKHDDGVQILPFFTTCLFRGCCLEDFLQFFLFRETNEKSKLPQCHSDSAGRLITSHTNNNNSVS